MNKKSFFRLPTLSFLLLLNGCAMESDSAPRGQRSAGPVPSVNAKRHYENDNLWIDDNIPGSPSVKIVLSEQRVYFYKGGKLAGMSPISTGNEGHATTLGHFQITEMDPEHESTLYGNYVDANDKIIQADVDTSKDPKPSGATYKGATMAHFMRFNVGTGMHEGFMPGYPDSHGCIRMPGWFAAALYDAVSVGTPVTVER